MNRKPIYINNNDVKYEALKDAQIKMDNNAGKGSLSFPIWSTVTMQHEDGGSWMHRVNEETNNSDDRGEILHNQGNEDGQTDNVEHKAHVHHPNNYIVPLRTDKEKNWMIREHFYAENASRA